MKKQLSLFLIVIIIGSLIPSNLAEENVEEKVAESNLQNFHFLQYIQDSIRMNAIKNLVDMIYPTYAQEEKTLIEEARQAREFSEKRVENAGEQSEKVVIEAMNILQDMVSKINAASPPPFNGDKQEVGFLGGLIGGIFSSSGKQTSGFQTGNPTPSQEAIGATYGALQGVLGSNLGDTTGAQATQLQTVNGIQLTLPVTANPNVILTTPVSTIANQPAPTNGFTIITVRPTAGNQQGVIAQTVVSAQNTGVASLGAVIAGRTSASSLGNSIGNVLELTVGQAIAGGNTGSLGNTVATNENTLAVSIAGLLAGSKTGSSSSAGSIGEVIGNNAVQTVGHVISGPTGTLARTVAGAFSSLAHTIVGQGGSIARIIAGNFQIIAGPPAPHTAPVAVVTGVQRQLDYGYEPKSGALESHLINSYNLPNVVVAQYDD